MLEIVFSDSEKLLLERSNLFIKEDILSLTFLLSMGKLDDFEYQTKRTIGDIEVNIPSEISICFYNCHYLCLWRNYFFYFAYIIY
jgi:hypothetical protein